MDLRRSGRCKGRPRAGNTHGGGRRVGDTDTRSRQRAPCRKRVIRPGALPAVRTGGSGGERPAFENAVEHLGGGGEGAGAVRDDLHRAADAPEHADIGVGRPLDLEAVGAHDAPAREPPAVGKREGRAPAHDRLEGLGAGHGEGAVEAEAGAHGLDLFGIEHAPDQRLAGIRRKPAHPHVLGGQPVPDRQQQAGGEPETGFPVRRKLGDLVVPDRPPAGLVGAAPVGGVELGLRHGLAGRGADEADALLHAAVVEHARGRRQQHGGALRARVDRQPGPVVGSGFAGADPERGIGIERFQLVAAHDLDQLGDRPGAGMLVEGLAPGDGEGIGAHGLDADLEAAGLDGLLDVLRDAGLQFGEELVLLVDGERQQPVQEARHRRQVLLEVALMDQLEAGGVLETVERPARDVAAPERDIETAQCGFRIDALQVVALAEERLVAAAHGGLANPAGPRVMAPRLSSRRAMVAMKRRSPFTSVATGRKSGAEAWWVLWVRPRPWIAWSARQPGSSK